MYYWAKMSTPENMVTNPLQIVHWSDSILILHDIRLTLEQSLNKVRIALQHYV